ncbi:MAG: hypothetical protein ACJAS3_002999 [Roseivirga sp.]|jgi:hypothetical protein
MNWDVALARHESSHSSLLGFSQNNGLGIG